MSASLVRSVGGVNVAPAAFITGHNLGGARQNAEACRLGGIDHFAPIYPGFAECGHRSAPSVTSRKTGRQTKARTGFLRPPATDIPVGFGQTDRHPGSDDGGARRTSVPWSPTHSGVSSIRQLPAEYAQTRRARPGLDDRHGVRPGRRVAGRVVSGETSVELDVRGGRARR